MSIYTSLLKKYWYIILLIVVLITVASFGVSIFQTPKYRSTVKLLVIQQQGQQLDAYTAARSAQTVGEILSKMVYTSSFFDRVLTSGFKIKDDFSRDPEERKKEWKETIGARIIDETGTIQVDVYHQNSKQAEQLAFGIAYVMINFGDQYHGGGNRVEVKMVDLPWTSDKPVKPNVIQNTAAGFILSLFTSVALVLLLGTRKSMSGQSNQEKKEEWKIE
jgi:capsular polysaccharide biosynthesis protein